MSKQTHSTFIPPQEVADAARKGLLFRQKTGHGGTEVGLARAKQLSQRQPVSEDEIIKIVSYFARHTVDKNAAHFGDEDKPSKGYIAWLLWGGDAGKKWAESIKKEFES